jgi:hypothetical protein
MVVVGGTRVFAGLVDWACTDKDTEKVAGRKKVAIRSEPRGGNSINDNISIYKVMVLTYDRTGTFLYDRRRCT